MRQPWPHHHRRKHEQQQQRSKTQPQRKKNHRVAVLPPTYEEENPANDDNNAVVFNKGSFLPSAITESSRSEGDDDFFLHSFDDDQHSQSSSNFTTRTSSLDVASTRQQLEEEHKQNRDEAMALLGGFFQLGGELEEMVVNSSSIQTVPTTIISSDGGGGGDSSPRSVISLFGSSESNASLPPRIPEEQNVFEKFIAKVFSAKPSSKAKEMSPSSSSPKFAMLKKADRSISLPVERTQYSSSSTTTLGPKRPSLKKISSIGNFPKSQSDASLKRSVSFGKLNIRKYNVAISDHPSCSYGPPVQLSWDFDKSKEEEIPLESYEQARQPRRQPNDLVLSYYDRRYLLIKQGGYSKREVKEAVKEVERVKRERMVTDLFLPASPIEETIGSVVDSVRGIFAAPNDDDDQRSQHLEAYVMPQFHSL